MKHYDAGMLAMVAATLMGNNPNKYARISPQHDEQFDLAAADAKKLVDACDVECAKANAVEPDPTSGAERDSDEEKE